MIATNSATAFPKLYDTLIIGSGPAGLSTALGLARQNRPSLVISHGKFRNDGIEASHSALGHDHIHPQTILAKAKQQIDRYGTTTYLEAEIVTVEKQKSSQWANHEIFKASSRDGQAWLGKTLLLATGVSDILPDLDGYAENWPRNIYQCLFCDGWDRRQTQKAVLCLNGLSLMETKMASMALNQDKTKANDGHVKLTILTNGPLPPTDDDNPALATHIASLKARTVKFDTRKVIKLENAEPEGKEGLYVHLQDPMTSKISRVHFGFLVHKPRTALNARALIDRLGLETTTGGPLGEYLKMSGMMGSTNVPGVFAAGDAAVMVTTVVSAMQSGLAAAGGIAHYLNELDDEDALRDGDLAEIMKKKKSEVGDVAAEHGCVQTE